MMGTDIKGDWKIMSKWAESMPSKSPDLQLRDLDYLRSISTKYQIKQSTSNSKCSTCLSNLPFGLVAEQESCPNAVYWSKKQFTTFVP